MRGYYSYINTGDTYFDEAAHATYKGISVKTSILLAITIITAVLTGFYLPTILTNNPSGFYTALIAAVIIGFISVIVGRLSDRAARVCSVIYSLCEGLLLGTITTIVNAYVPGAGTFCVTATMVIFTIVLVLYSCGFLRNFGKIRMIAFAIIMAVLALAVLDLILVLTTNTDSYGLYILIQALLVVYGVITLTFNFAEADMVVKYGASKNAEWSVALGILVSLVYIYIYLLRLVLYLSMSNRR